MMKLLFVVTDKLIANLTIVREPLSEQHRIKLIREGSSL